MKFLQQGYLKNLPFSPHLRSQGLNWEETTGCPKGPAWSSLRMGEWISPLGHRLLLRSGLQAKY